MNHLHPYWRIPYISAPKAPNAADIFSELPKNPDDKATHILHRGKFAYIVLNAFPYNAGHLLVLPYRPVINLAELDAPERAELLDLIVLGQQILTDAFHPDGFNIGFNIGATAGAGLPKHLHAHIVPRWNGDSNFLPVIGDTRLLIESLDATWQRLRQFCPAADKGGITNYELQITNEAEAAAGTIAASSAAGSAAAGTPAPAAGSK